MRDTKAALDAHSILKPGRVLASGSAVLRAELDIVPNALALGGMGLAVAAGIALARR